MEGSLPSSLKQAYDKLCLTGKQNVTHRSLHGISSVQAFFKCCLLAGPHKSFND